MRRYTISVCITAILLTMAVPVPMSEADGPIIRAIRGVRVVGARLTGRNVNFTRSTSYRTGGYMPTWTVAGGDHNVSNHLSGWPHYIDTSGMSHTQMMMVHDQHHNQIGPVSDRQLAVHRHVSTPRRTKTVTRNTYCPTCPQTAQVVSNTPIQQSTPVCENGVCYVQPTVTIAQPRGPPTRRISEVKITPEIVESRVRDEMRGSPTFRRELIRVIKSQRTAGKITGRQAVRLRTALLSPAFLKEAQTLAVTQMSFSGEDAQNNAFELDENGNVLEASINWEGLTNFLVTILPLIADLLIQFGLGP